MARQHQHRATGETRGHVYEACACGAVRTLSRITGEYDAWHACKACTGDTGNGMTGEADTDFGARIDAQRVTLQFAQRSSKPLDTGRIPFDESPLFGGRRQRSLFDGEGRGQ